MATAGVTSVSWVGAAIFIWYFANPCCSIFEIETCVIKVVVRDSQLDSVLLVGAEEVNVLSKARSTWVHFFYGWLVDGGWWLGSTLSVHEFQLTCFWALQWGGERDHEDNGGVPFPNSSTIFPFSTLIRAFHPKPSWSWAGRRIDRMHCWSVDLIAFHDCWLSWSWEMNSVMQSVTDMSLHSHQFTNSCWYSHCHLGRYYRASEKERSCLSRKSTEWQINFLVK